jgi:DNA replication protein DnaC
VVEPLPPMPEEWCPKCRGVGYVRRQLPMGHPDYGKKFECECTLEETKKQRLTQMVKDADLTDEMADMTFENFSLTWDEAFPDDNEKTRKAFEAAWKFVSDPASPPWLFMEGGMGRGKTHLSAAIAHTLIDRGEVVMFRVVPRLLKWFQASFNLKEKSDQDDYQTRFDEVCNAPVLILDDFGAHKDSEWARQELFTLLNHRYSRNLRTVISTNLSIQEVEPRVQDRILDKRRCMYIDTGKQSYRLHTWDGE